MSANLLEGATVRRGTRDADGLWVLSQGDGTDKKDSPVWRIDGQPNLTENQTMHMACSVMPEADWPANACFASVGYTDGAGNSHWAPKDLASPAKSGTWTRLEASATIPSGMRVTGFVISNAYKNSSGAKLASPTLSYGSPVTLASDAHTPYATQDHVTAELNGMRDTVAPTEDAGAASRNYAVGEFFYDASHNLCRVTQAVSQGASLVSGTNYTTVSGGVQQYIGTPTYVYETAPSEATVKAAHATPCFVYAVDTASFYYVS